MLTGIFLSIFAAMSWGLAYVLEQKILVDFSVLKFLFYKSAFFLVIIVPIIFFLPRIDLKISVLDFKILTQPFFLLLIAINLIADFLILKSIQTIGAATAAIFEIVYPIFTVLFAYFILQSSIHWLTMIGAITMIIGSAIVIYASNL